MTDTCCIRPVSSSLMSENDYAADNSWQCCLLFVLILIAFSFCNMKSRKHFHSQWLSFDCVIPRLFVSAFLCYQIIIKCDEYTTKHIKLPKLKKYYFLKCVTKKKYRSFSNIQNKWKYFIKQTKFAFICIPLKSKFVISWIMSHPYLLVHQMVCGNHIQATTAY